MVFFSEILFHVVFDVEALIKIFKDFIKCFFNVISVKMPKGFYILFSSKILLLRDFTSYFEVEV